MRLACSVRSWCELLLDELVALRFDHFRKGVYVMCTPRSAIDRGGVIVGTLRAVVATLLALPV